MSRTQAAISLIAIVPMLLLGAVWPTLFTLIALLAFPAFLFAMAALIRPKLLRRRPLQLYVHGSTLVCALGLGVQVVYMLATHSQPVDVIIPADIRGTVYVVFNVADGRSPRLEDGRQIYEIPPTGVLLTQFVPNEGWWWRGERRFFVREPSGVLRPVEGRLVGTGVSPVELCSVRADQYVIENASARKTTTVGSWPDEWGVQCRYGRLARK